MRNSRRLVLVLLVITLLVIPATAFASVVRFNAKLTPWFEVPPRPAGPERGRFELEILRGAKNFRVTGTALSGDPVGIHLHAPASTTENAAVWLSLCGAPGPAAVATCPSVDVNGNFVLTGQITNSLMQAWGVTGAQFEQYLGSGLVYINVHTAANPAGEIRGQVELAPPPVGP